MRRLGLLVCTAAICAGPSVCLGQRAHQRVKIQVYQDGQSIEASPLASRDGNLAKPPVQSASEKRPARLKEPAGAGGFRPFIPPRATETSRSGKSAGQNWRLAKGVKIQEFRRPGETAFEATEPAPKLAAPFTSKPFETNPFAANRIGPNLQNRSPSASNDPTSPIDAHLRKTVEDLRRSVRELKQSLANSQTNEKEQAAVSETGPRLRRIQVDELAHYPGLSAQRLIRRDDGRLVRAPWPKPVSPLSASGEITQASRDERATHPFLDPAPTPFEFQTSTNPQPSHSWIAALLQAPADQAPADQSSADQSSADQSAEEPSAKPGGRALSPKQFEGPTNQVTPIRLEGDKGPTPGPGEAEPLNEVADAKPIGRIGAALRADDGELPPDYASMRFAQAGEVRHGPGATRQWGEAAFRWEAAAMHHQPLYFEDINLERHGYSTGILQPVVSAAHFFGRVPALPYLVGARPHRECVYTLGHYRPGSCAPFERHWPRASLRGALFEAGAVTGLIWLVP